jgi:hypothetical protein
MRIEKILFIGDIIGKPGRIGVQNSLNRLIERYKPDFIIANGENAAHGMGINPKIAQFLFSLGIDVLTSGNHIWDQKQIIEYLPSEGRLLRPANYPAGVPGAGYGIFLSKTGSKICVINLEGRVFMKALIDSPFIAAKAIIEEIKEKSDAIIIDFHAEATSEKEALGFYLDGKISALIGTHTHVQTNDDIILPKGTAYISDAGMVGSRYSVLGTQKDIAVNKYLTNMPAKFVPEENSIMLNGVFITLDAETKLSKSIEKINIDV